MKFSLEFNPSNYTVQTLTIDSQTITYRAFENNVYVENPVDTKYQIMNIYVPEAYYEGKTIGSYTASTAPIFMPNTVGGYMPGAPEKPGKHPWHGGVNAAFAALLKGYVVAAPGVRGRVTQDEKGVYTGKAPACIVDLKAAVRYLRYNRKAIPGDTEKIISNGTSAGGALSSLLGVTGNNADYEPYLRELGAAYERDDIFAASCYCPITNLDNADIAYEWMYNGLNDYTKVVLETVTGEKFIPGITPPEQIRRVFVSDTMTEEQIKVSNKLKGLFPSYLNSLGLKKADGTELTLDANGNGSFKDYVKSFVIASAQKALDSDADLYEFDWITIKDGIVKDIDFDKYVQYATRMKPATAFDGLNLDTPENDLFGTKDIKAQHFTQFAKEHSTAQGSLADASIVKLLNPMNYIGREGTSTARYWRIRHGAIDRDTSLAIPVILAAKLANNGFDVNLEMPWGQGHGGDYDLEELFAWIKKICIS
ncbi:alpha/beta hydrolase [Clostridium sp. SYSU_GA19001]|uniref:subtype B tannase n=1 Tax=Clostridium caldaquaticum TaxID=2940653 RepID=UPI002076F7C8|nr:subtype B tannase [Clostridium caldaquaticum]MCM8710309.1 alpha/beta hydrolase [Clostridium caldaquaticum]